ncbi:MAG: PAS domain-containing protein, partial [Acidimicrobiales bacterium]
MSTAGIYKSLLDGELEADEAVRASQQMLQMVMASIPQGVYWKDRDLRFLGCNQVFADVAGHDPAYVVGRTDSELSWTTLDAGNYRNWDERVIESGKPRFEIHEPIHGADGEIRWLETNKVPLVDFRGDVVGLLGTFQDVTARLRAQQQLSEALSELDERVRERTGALSAANEALRQEVEERSRLQELERQQRAYAEALRDTAAAFNQSVEIDDVLEQVVESLFRLIEIDVAAVLIVGDDGQMTLARSAVIAGTELEPGYPAGVELAVASSEPFESMVIDASHPGWPGARLAVESQSVLISPISLAGKPIGYVIAESSAPSRFTESDAKGIRFIADQTAAAFTTVQLISQARELAAIDERQHLAREL